MPSSLHDLTPEAIRRLMADWGEPSYRASQLAEGLYARGVTSLDEVTNLPKNLRGRLAGEFAFTQAAAASEKRDDDGTTKYLLAFADGAQVEAVYLPREGDRQTFCISSQVGCRLACVFCATGRMGLIRSLSPGEIVAQVLELRRRHPSKRNPNLVFMGMGEPLDNRAAVREALDILCDPDGVGLSARRITVSTAGLIEGIAEMTQWGRPYGLAVSLTTGIESERRELMPIAARAPMDELLRTAAEYGRHTKRKVTLECAIIAGKNDTLEHARQLLRLARRGPFKINLIPLNPIDRFDGQRPTRERLRPFVDLLWQGGIVTTVRDSQGRSVDAACGQLLRRQRRADLGGDGA